MKSIFVFLVDNFTVQFSNLLKLPLEWKTIQLNGSRNYRELRETGPWPGTLSCVLGQDTSLSQFHSPPRCINGYQRILRNFTEGNSRNLIKIFLFFFFHLNGNYVIRIATRQDRYVGTREFSNHAVLSMSDSAMAVSSKYTQDLSVQIVFFTFSFKWFLCFYFWAVI